MKSTPGRIGNHCLLRVCADPTRNQREDFVKEPCSGCGIEIAVPSLVSVRINLQPELSALTRTTSGLKYT